MSSAHPNLEALLKRDLQPTQVVIDLSHGGVDDGLGIG
jgi:hypothetical protein